MDRHRRGVHDDADKPGTRTKDVLRVPSPARTPVDTQIGELVRRWVETNFGPRYRFQDRGKWRCTLLDRPSSRRRDPSKRTLDGSQWGSRLPHPSSLETASTGRIRPGRCQAPSQKDPKDPERARSASGSVPHEFGPILRRLNLGNGPERTQKPGPPTRRAYH